MILNLQAIHKTIHRLCARLKIQCLDDTEGTELITVGLLTRRRRRRIIQNYQAKETEKMFLTQAAIHTGPE